MSPSFDRGRRRLTGKGRSAAVLVAVLLLGGLLWIKPGGKPSATEFEPISRAETSDRAETSRRIVRQRVCENSCPTANDGICQEGRPASERSQNASSPFFEVLCDFGTDCSDCGPWEFEGAEGALRWEPVAGLRAKTTKLLVRTTDTPRPFEFGYTDPEHDVDVSGKIHRSGHFEPWLTHIWSNILAEGCVRPDGSSALVADVGGNFGYYAVLAATWGCRVITWEPVPLFADFLRFNLLANNLTSRVELRERAVGDQPSGTVELLVPNRGIWGLAGVGGDNLDPNVKNEGAYDRVERRVERVDNVITGWKDGPAAKASPGAVTATAGGGRRRLLDAPPRRAAKGDPDGPRDPPGGGGEDAPGRGGPHDGGEGGPEGAGPPGGKRARRSPWGGKPKAAQPASLYAPGGSLGARDSEVLIMKADVEGYELEVLRGAAGLLKGRRIANLFVEYSPGVSIRAGKPNRTIEYVGGLHALAAAGYKISNVPFDWPSGHAGGWAGNPLPLTSVPLETVVSDLMDATDFAEGRLGCPLPLELEPHASLLYQCNSYPLAARPTSFYSSFNYNTNIWAARTLPAWIERSTVAAVQPPHADPATQYYKEGPFGMAGQRCDGIDARHALARRCPCPDPAVCGDAAKVLQSLAERASLPNGKKRDVSALRESFTVENW